MSDIINDIVEEIEIKPNKFKQYLKWIINISLGLISMAFIFGQVKVNHINKLNRMQESIDVLGSNQKELKNEMINGFNSINNRIDRIYTDGYDAFIDYQHFNNKQLELIIDYNTSNKDLLKKMLEINAIEKSRNFENQIELAKNESRNNKIKGSSIGVDDDDYQNFFFSKNGNDTIFNVIGANETYLNKININKYQIIEIKKSDTYNNSYDIKFKNKL